MSMFKKQHIVKWTKSVITASNKYNFMKTKDSLGRFMMQILPFGGFSKLRVKRPAFFHLKIWIEKLQIAFKTDKEEAIYRHIINCIMNFKIVYINYNMHYFSIKVYQI